MKNILILACGCLAAVSAVGAVDPAPIVSVGLYKNGNAVLTRKVTPERGVALVEISACLPSYGTFWHTAKTPVKVMTAREPKKVKVTFRADSQLGELLSAAEKSSDMTVTASVPDYNCQQKGASVAYFTVTGENLECEGPVHDPNRSHYAVDYEASYRIRLASGSVVTVRKSLVVASSGLDDPVTGQGRSPHFWKFEGSDEPFGVSYLTAGATWAPSYLLSFGRDGQADFIMSAEIRNEIADWQDVDVLLISGFPSIRYASVRALVGDRRIGEFTSEIGAAESEEDRNNGGWYGRKAKIGMMTQGACYASDGFAAGAHSDAYQAAGMGAGAGSDIHYRPIGKLSLKKDATVSLPLGAKKTGFKRIVDWDIVDRRDYWGRLQRSDENGKEQELWDSVKFKNPFDFPLTTGAIEITEEGRIVGQAQCAWTNPGDETLVKITKALSVKGRCDEESDGKGVRGKVSSLASDERFRYNGDDYRKETITAKIRVQNFRKEAATLNVRKVFSGELVESDVKPTKTRNLPVRDGRVNVERELAWEFDLKPGEAKEMGVVYWLWVRM